MNTEGEPIKPIILDGGQNAGPYRPATEYRPPTGGLEMREPSRTHATLRGSVAGFLILSGIGNFVAATGFPSNAPVESLFMFLLSVDMFLAAVVLIIFAVLAGARRSVPVLPERTSPLSIAGLVVSAVAFVAWALFGLVPTLAAIGAGEPVRYMTLVGVLVFFGIPWMLGMVFGAISLRSGGPRTALFGGIALGLGVLLVLAVLAATILYGMGLTD
jgi:hypothetical protein